MKKYMLCFFISGFIWFVIGYEVHINHYFTDTDAWFIRTDITADTGLRWFDRVKTEFAMDDDFKTTNALYRARFRCSVGISDKRSIYGSPGA